MARWYCIPPANYLEDMANWRTHMIIAPHAIGKTDAHFKYHKFYVYHPDLYTIIDNGLWEGHVVSNKKLLELASKYCCDEIIAPDSPYGAVTSRKTKQFIDFLKQKGRRKDFKVHGVIHGGNTKDRLKCFNNLIKIGVDVIDLPKSFGPQGREDMMTYINPTLEDARIPIHFLGFYKEELPILKDQCLYTSPRSFDTSVPFKPKYEDGFQLDLPYTWWNKTIINRRVRYYKKTYE